MAAPSDAAVTLLSGINELSSECKAKILDFIRWTPNATDAALCLKLISDKSNLLTIEKMEAQFTSRLEFGTAGLRGPMDVGFNKMNDLTVLQTTQGLCQYLLTRFGAELARTRGVVIGFDGRHRSERFANVVAAVFLSRGFTVRLFSSMTATPLNPFTVSRRRHLAGVQITASHNPKNDNGYKVYADNGVQIIPPMDSEVASLILDNLEPWAEAIDLISTTNGHIDRTSDTVALLLVDEVEALSEEYVSATAASLWDGSKAQANDPNFVYTAMHGVGTPFIKNMMKRFCFSDNIIYVKEQCTPDPEFSSVPFPNPEERGALSLAFALGDKISAPVVIANDPDADRFAAAEKQGDGVWKQFTGDELGILLADYLTKLKQSKGVQRSSMLYVCSAVSSRMMGRMVEDEGGIFEDTMTGFKWMMNRAKEVQAERGAIPVLVYEEALGYAADPDNVPDKDGVSAAAVWVQMTLGVYRSGSTLQKQLENLQKRYGYFVSNNGYYLCHDKGVLDSVFEEFRNGGKYTSAIGSYDLVRIRDPTTGYDNGQPNNRCTFPLTPTSQMITLFFANNAVITLRTSGTEPKLKYYAELSAESLLIAKEEIARVVATVVAHVIHPEERGMAPSAS